MREKGRKVAKHCVFPVIWGSGGSKSRLAKAAGAEPAGQMRDEKLHAVVARSTFASQKCTKHLSSGPRLEVAMSKKVHAVVARSTFPSQNVQNPAASDHFWKLRCWQSARRCGAKHISKSKFWKLRCRKSARPCGTKHISKSKMYKTHQVLPLLAVEMSKKCTPLWREAHLQVKMYKTPQLRTTFGSCDVEKVHAVVARSTFPSQNVQNPAASDHFWKLRCWLKCTPLWREAHFEAKMYKTLGVRTTFGGSDVASLRFGSLHYTIHSTTLQYITLHYTPQRYNYNCRTTQLHSTTLHYIKLQYATPHCTTLHYTTLHYTTLDTPLNYTTLNYTTLYSPHTTVHYTTLHSTTLQLQLQNYTTTLHYTPLHTATLNYTTLYTLHYTRKIDR